MNKKLKLFSIILFPVAIMLDVMPVGCKKINTKREAVFVTDSSQIYINLKSKNQIDEIDIPKDFRNDDKIKGWSIKSIAEYKLSTPDIMPYYEYIPISFPYVFEESALHYYQGHRNCLDLYAVYDDLN